MGQRELAEHGDAISGTRSSRGRVPIAPLRLAP